MPSFTGGFFCAKLEDERKYIFNMSNNIYINIVNYING